MIKILMGGSPCTYWSIAQTKNRETEASGMGWELFKNYLIAIEKYQPDYFLYENNKSMSAAIREQITKEFGFEPVMIDSALVSAQSRKRLYWLGRREPSGTYSRVNVELPEDRGILLRDILETGVAFREKTYHLDANYHIRLLDMDEQPIPLNMTEAGKAQCLRATCYKDGIRNMIANEVDRRTCVAEPVRVCNIDGGSQGNRIYSPDAKSCAIKANSGGLGGRGQGLYAEPIRVGIFPNAEGEITHCQSKRIYSIEGKGRVLNAGPGGLGVQTGLYAEPVRIGTIESDAKNPGHDSQQYRVYSPDDKSVTLCGAGGGGIGAKTGLYAVPICRNQCLSGRQPSRDMQKSCLGNVWTCPCCPARRGGADE